MQVAVKNLSDLEHCMIIELPSQTLRQAVDERLQETARTIKLKGFRPGHVPVGEAKRRFGKQVEQEVAHQLMLDSFIKAIEEKSLRPAGSPEFKPLADEKSADAFRFEAVFEVLPEISLADFSGIEIRKPVVEVAEADIDTAIEEIRKSRQTFELEEGRTCAEGDQVVVDWTGKVYDKDGKLHEETRSDLPLVLDKKALLPEIVEGLAGARAGDKRIIELARRPSSEGEEKPTDNSADKPSLIECIVKSVATPKLPELDGDFIAGFGMPASNLEDFREKLRESMAKRLERAVWQRTKTQVFDQLLALHKSVQLPKVLVDRELARVQQEAAQRGMPPSDDTEIVDAQRLTAGNTVRLQLVFEQLVKDQAIEVDKTLVRERIEELATGHPEAQKVIEWYYSDEAQFNRIQAMVLEDQVIQKIVDKAKLQEEKRTYSQVLEG